MNTCEKGHAGEECAVAYLKKKGWRILDRNYRSGIGEIDVIGLDGKTLVFVEVKSWSVYGRDSLELGVNLKKRRKIIGVSRDYLMRNENLEFDLIRYDVVFLDGRRDVIDHYRDAFTENGEL